MSKNQKRYDTDYKIQAVKLALEVGVAKACHELNVPSSTMNGWMRAYRKGSIDVGAGTRTPENALSLAEELTALRKQVKDQNREIKRLKEENEFLAEASAFFAASRRKSAN